MPIFVHAFAGPKLLAAGPLEEVAAAVRAAPEAEPILVFDDATGDAIDFDRGGSPANVHGQAGGEAEARGRGRPKLGVTGREVTLLPRHWDWLAAQPGGASVALRKLVDAARKQSEPADRERAARERAYRFMHALGGDLTGFEEASRALFAGDRAQLDARLAVWPRDVADYTRALLAEV